jgi:hypothetical protein
MRRMFWIAVGLGAGATATFLVSRWMRQQAERMAPPNLARQAGQALTDLGALAQEAIREFRAGMAEREAELRTQISR